MTTVIEVKPQSRQLQAPMEAPLGDQVPTLINQRIISTGSNEATIAFNADRAGAVTLKLHPTGAERGSETQINITAVEDLDSPEMPIALSDGVITLNVDNNRRIRLKITAGQDISHLAFTFQ